MAKKKSVPFFVVYAAALWWMWTAPGQHHREQFVLSSIVLGWTAGTVLTWIGRPAAEVPSPTLTTTRALLELVVCGLVISSTGAHALLFGAALIIAVRIVMRYSYQNWGGVQPTAVSWLRWMLAIAVPLIARLPEPSR